MPTEVPVQTAILVSATRLPQNQEFMNLIASAGAARSILLAVLLLPAMARGQQRAGSATDTLLSLEELLDEARINNPSLRASRLEAEALAYTNSQVSALPDPTVMVTWQPYAVLTARGTMRSQWRVEQMIPFPGKLGLRGDIADLSAEVARFEADTFELDLLFQVKQTYYELFRIQQHEELILAFQDRLESFADDAAVQYAVGRGMQQAVLKAQLEGNALSQRLISLDEQRRTATETLARLLDRPVSEAVRADVRFETPKVPEFNEDTLLAIAFRERPEFDALDVAARRADTQITLARKEFWPDFGVSLTFFDIGANEVPPTADGRNALGIAASIKVPLQRGRLRARLDEARVRRAQIEARQEALETSFRTQLADLVSRLQEEARQLDLYRTALIPQAETTLQATLSAYTTGRTDFLDLLDAERMLFSLGTGYEDTLARYLKMTAALERALGISSLQELTVR